MKRFRVYRHPVQGLQAVKIGVSWPAFFFTLFWMLAKRLWGYAVLWFFAAFVLSNMEKVADSSPEGSAQAVVYLAIMAGWLAYALVPLFKGNKWREANLKSRGFELVSTSEATTPDAAIANIANMKQQ